MKHESVRDQAFQLFIAACEQHIGFAGMDRLSEAQIFAAGWSAHEQFTEQFLGLPPSDRTVAAGTPFPWFRARDAEQEADPDV